MRTASSNEPQLNAEYAQTATWDGGLIGTFTISNQAATTASDWKLEFTMPRGSQVAGVWNGSLATSNNSYTVTPTAQTKTIAGHGSVKIGFTALVSSPVAPLKCTINGELCTIRAGGTSDTQITGGHSGGTTRGDGSGADTPSVVPGQSAGADPGPADPNKADKPGRTDRTILTPLVNLLAGDRPPLTAIAAASGATVLTLLSAVPSVDGSCQLKWGGTLDLNAFAKEISDALRAKIKLVVSIGAASGIDLTQVCTSVDALVVQLKTLLSLGVRAIDFTLSGSVLANNTLNLRRAQLIKDLKARYAGLELSYTLPLVGSLLGGSSALTLPLQAVKNVGTLLDRVNILPLDLAAPAGLLTSLLNTISLDSSIDTLLGAVAAVHDKLMSTWNLDAGSAWGLLGVVPLLGGNDLLGKTPLLGTVSKLVDFVKANKLGLLGLLPVNGGGQACPDGGLLGGLLPVPLLGCLDATILAHLFTLTNSLTQTLH
jgi:Cellulose binding domain